MKRMYVLGNTLTLLWGVLAAPAVLHAQTPVGTAFTYQGQLKQAGEPLDDTADFEFSLWADPNSTDPGNLVAGPLAADNVDVEGGLFTVLLDFGEGVFSGDARWLEIAVRSPAGGGEFTTLSPRQELTPAPYALMAANTVGLDGHSLDAADGSPVNAVYVGDDGRIRLGGTGGAGPKTVNIHGGMDVFDDDGMGTSEGIRFTSNSYEFAELVGETPIWDYYQTTDTHRFYTGDQTLRMTIASDGNIGIGTPSPSYPLHVENASPDGIAIYGLGDNSDPGSTGIGVYGRSDSDGGVGVYGEAPYLTGSAYGVRGVSDYGTGVRGDHQDTGNFGALGRHFEGVYGESDYGVSGIGVHGKWTGSFPGFGYGGTFTTTSHLAAGVLAINEATEPGGIGVIGVHEHTSGEGFGVRGETASSDGHGVHGYASATSGANRGVYGETDSSTGYAGYFVGGRNYFEGRVGIGTTDPLAKLHVEESQADDLLRVRQGGSTKFIVKNDGRVGIGTSGPDVELEVVGDVQVSGDYTYLSSQTHYLNIPACEFHEGNADDPPDRDNDYILYESGYACVSAPTAEVFSPVHLPDGATVTEFRVYYYDNSPWDMSINASLYARTLYQITEPTTMASISVTTSGAVAAVESSYDDTIDLPLINNTSYQYYVWLTVDQNAYGGLPERRLYGCKIEYTIDTLNP